VLDVCGYFGHLRAFLDHAVDERFLRPQHRDLLVCEEDPEALLDAFAAWRAPTVAKWIDAAER
jgi:predicted Rossmann-fold nucleotide-binding protein